MVEKKSSERLRAWTFILYPESAPDDWREILDDEHIEWAESPLHDKDINADGTPKKPHKHILLSFPGKKSYEQIKAITDKLNCPVPQKCHNQKSLVRYFCHLDNPDKAQYKTSDIISHGGFNVDDVLKPSTSEVYEKIAEMIDYVRMYNITEFQDLMDYAISNRYDDWFPLLCDRCAFVIDKYIKSQRHRQVGKQ